MPAVWRGVRRLGTASASAASAVRCATTGAHHSYRPGPVARLLRRVYVAVTPRRLHRRMAVRLQAGMERVQELEKEQLWLQQHGSPLRVMGLPEHADLVEVRSRYRDLVFATHPDTAQGNAKVQYDTIQTAYRMATSPTSLWHQNGSAPALYHHLVATSARATRRVWHQNGSAPALYHHLVATSARATRRVNRVTLFAFLSYCVMGVVGIIFSAVVVRQLLEVALRLFDPEFYAFMVAQEQDEERRRLAGEVVDTDPKRLAPTAVKRLLFPGRFVHKKNTSNNSSSSNDEGGSDG
ncbi:chaperone protein DNAJ [Trypanosoma grayi]|uniref:chaperone protein DNAJ n=1 Tax=Trypanosoma grayi TaxID=71804 RepID=UPI0004F4605A|nr:chaperone protein DNAJ [Trypanosoma grayi]KEG11926.1 chaperone protein DNAJ [Trypanosoma grayi]